MHALQPHLAALINLGGNPLVTLLAVLILAGIIWLLWTKVAMPLLAQIVGEPFLGIANYIVMAILIIWVLSVALEVIFGISLFGSLNGG